MIEAVLFDMDGILIDSEPVWYEARQKIFSRYGLAWTERDHQAVMGASTDAWVTHMQKRLGNRMSRDEIQREVIEQMVENYEKGIHFIDGAVDTVHEIKDHFRVGLASGSAAELVEIVVNSPELQDCFEVVISTDNVGRGKPHPEVYLEAARRLEVAAEVCLVVEDSGNGIEAGYRAGMKVIAIPRPDAPPPDDQLALADLFLPSILALNVTRIRQEFNPS